MATIEARIRALESRRRQVQPDYGLSVGERDQIERIIKAHCAGESLEGFDSELIEVVLGVREKF